MCNATTRNLLVNMGFSAAPQAAMDDASRLHPIDNGKAFPAKTWAFLNEGNSNQRPINFWNIPSVAKELIEIFSFYMRLADEITGIPAFANGTDAAVGAARTATGLNMLFGAANRGIKKIIGNIDEMFKSCVMRLYWWHMRYSRDDSIKGDISVEVCGVRQFTLREQLAQKQLELLKVVGQDQRIQQLQTPHDLARMLRDIATGFDLDPDCIAPTSDELDHRIEMAKAEAQRQMAEQVQALQEQSEQQGIMVSDDAAQQPAPGYRPVTEAGQGARTDEAQPGQQGGEKIELTQEELAQRIEAGKREIKGLYESRLAGMTQLSEENKNLRKRVEELETERAALTANARPDIGTLRKEYPEFAHYDDDELVQIVSAVRKTVASEISKALPAAAKNIRQEFAASGKATAMQSFIAQIEGKFPGFTKLDSENDPAWTAFLDTAIPGAGGRITYRQPATDAIGRVDAQGLSEIIEEFARQSGTVFGSKTAPRVGSQIRPRQTGAGSRQQPNQQRSMSSRPTSSGSWTNGRAMPPSAPRSPSRKRSLARFSPPPIPPTPATTLVRSPGCGTWVPIPVPAPSRKRPSPSSSPRPAPSLTRTTSPTKTASSSAPCGSPTSASTPTSSRPTRNRRESGRKRRLTECFPKSRLPPSATQKPPARNTTKHVVYQCVTP